MNARITGLGAVTAWGLGVEATFAGALEGRIATGPSEALDLPELRAMHVGEALPRTAPGEDRAARLARLAVTEALADGGWDGARVRDPGTALLVATTKAGIGVGQHVLEGKAPADRLAAYPLAALGAELADELGVCGPVATISVACASGTAVLGHGLRLLRQGRARRVIVLGVDALSEFIALGFASLRATARGPARPFDVNRTGLVAGEGAAAVLLEGGEGPARARVVGYGGANDAVHVTGPAKDGRGLARALRMALRTAGMGPEQVDAVSAHGTATRYNDQMEGVAYRSVFGERPPPVHSLKGGIGHTMGAAGVVEAVVATRGLETGLWAPTAGFLEGDPELGLDIVHAEPRELPLACVVSSSSGFSGINAAVVLCRAR
ncbi:MAG: beta-ketoacyl-[acyl-carrier-protein] synthase family protein [Deltaproteobacteria bacterium]|nr:beta-ketoacyl-[acyl-carrier-protein] synthase family protein [Deltaproteobacteria bacterium]MCB9787214.1 beta-ketoacyl-[acyl-carrier-protein] synthase family protein [Deltaproteobacteria bacterium]